MSGQRGKQVHDVNAASQGLVFPPGAATKTGRQNQTQSVTSHQPGCGHTDSVSRSALGPTQLLSDLQKCLGNTECQTSSEKIHSPSTKTHSARGGAVLTLAPEERSQRRKKQTDGESWKKNDEFQNRARSDDVRAGPSSPSCNLCTTWTSL